MQHFSERVPCAIVVHHQGLDSRLWSKELVPRGTFSKAELGQYSATPLLNDVNLSERRATTTRAENAAWDGNFQAFEVIRVPETIRYLVYYILCVLLSCSIIRRKLGVPLAKPNQLG